MDINTASKSALISLVGIGEELADAIMAARPFARVNDLLRVSGIGEKRLAEIINQGVEVSVGEGIEVRQQRNESSFAISSYNESSFAISSYSVYTQTTVLTSNGSQFIKLAHIRCTGVGDGHSMVLFIWFMLDDGGLPPNYTIITNNGDWIGHMFRHASQYAWFIDLLRNEKPISGMLSVERAHLNYISTSEEPIGEAE